MKIGVDFDNTIVCFDPLFYAAALERNWIVPQTLATKTGVRDYLRAQGREEDWTRLQGVVYGEAIRYARPYPGVLNFFRHACDKSHEIAIVSHKTQKSALEPVYDLHAPARAWLNDNGFYRETGLEPKNVFFETAMDGKAKRISELQCDLFIDDLLEFLVRFDFPKKTKRLLFDPNRHHLEVKLERVSSWSEMERWIQ